MTVSERTVSEEILLFCARLQQLDAADRARLKRRAGAPLSEARDTLSLFYRLLPGGVQPSQEETWYLVATLFPLADGGGQGNLGQALRFARNERNAKGLDRRMAVLLDADNSQLPFRLRQTLRYLRSSRVMVDWPVLLSDLLYWNHPDRFVQRRWARSYYQSNALPSKGDN